MTSTTGATWDMLHHAAVLIEPAQQHHMAQPYTEPVAQTRHAMLCYNPIPVVTAEASLMPRWQLCCPFTLPLAGRFVQRLSHSPQKASARHSISDGPLLQRRSCPTLAHDTTQFPESPTKGPQSCSGRGGSLALLCLPCDTQNPQFNVKIVEAPCLSASRFIVRACQIKTISTLPNLVQNAVIRHVMTA